ncbi:hypothetical protein M406DRAFT_355361 [Cryphonectria parasitica EP155]|uniref:Uncharacterized protein n=1 Tax=Cryphonectria parasitica (strain ATCC 38755 / EP155) TaxID=660469 RepID=A0A9P4Y644_CRYP1|nr:uncharacterized protein M406DRAFT_355361 [Cryphonectria parasitica EP155]KAF3766785.1 hypothetical protein M406DRAFT_355361 [Cryphonectria parasitica EP155]
MHTRARHAPDDLSTKKQGRAVFRPHRRRARSALVRHTAILLGHPLLPCVFCAFVFPGSEASTQGIMPKPASTVSIA